jgi:hypothetical protein
MKELDGLIARGDPNSNILQVHIDFSEFLKRTKDGGAALMNLSSFRNE